MVTKVHFFGNPDTELDNKPFLFINQLHADFPEIDFIYIKPNEDLPDDQEDFYIVDTVMGINDIKILDETFIDKLSISANSSVHDYDLGFQLKYLKKLGKIKRIKILGLPMETQIDYSSFHSSFKKFVEQDIQGS